MAKRGGGGSGAVVLVVFLVFFILLSIGLGVSTYLGYSQEANKGEEIKKLTTEKKKATDDAEWYQFQALLFRAYMGNSPNLKYEDLAIGRDKFVAGALKGDGAEDLKLLVTTVLDKKLGWDNAQKRPKSDYEKLLGEQQRLREAAEATAKDLQVALDKEKKTVTDGLEREKTAADAHDKEFTALRDKAKMEREQDLKKIAELEGEITKVNVLLARARTANDEEKRLIVKSQTQKDARIRELTKQLGEEKAKFATLTKEQSSDLPAEFRTDWKIVRIDSRGEMAYINLGSADKVQPQLTFRVHGIGLGGRPEVKDKATLEVLNVLGEHLSQAKIIYVTEPRDNPRHDPTHNPVVTGDIIINPSWRPNQKKHIALAGVVDLTGSGRDETEQFIRALEKQNIVVDAYLDLRKDFTVKGPGISVQTDFMIIGEVPKEVLGVGAAQNEAIKTKINDGIKEMERQAKENGVRSLSLRAYMEQIGYRLPPSTESKQPVLDYKGDGAAKPPAVKQDDKPLPPPVPDK